jgi:hypothetical protein
MPNPAPKAVDHKRLEAALKEGCTVEVAGVTYGPRNARELPRQREDGPRVEGWVVRDAQGRLTREGMELALSQGGSVQFRGAPVTEVEDLPTPEDLERERAAYLADVAHQVPAQAGEVARLRAEAAEAARLRAELEELRAAPKHKK